MITVTGSGELAKAVAKVLIRNEHEVQVFGRSSVDSTDIISCYNQIPDYGSIEFNSNTDILLITNGSFIYRKFVDLNEEELYGKNFDSFASFVQTIKQWMFSNPRTLMIGDVNKKDTIIEKAIFAIPKGYALKFKEDSTIKIKGFKKDSISYEEFEKTFKEKKELVTTESYLEKVTFQLKFKEIEKTIILHNYDKRKFNKDKSDTEPLYIEKIIDP